MTSERMDNSRKPWTEKDAQRLLKRVYGGPDYELKDMIGYALSPQFGERIPTRNAWCYRFVNHSVVFHGTPLVSLRRTAWKNCLREWEWFMSGSNKLEDLHPSVKEWWRPWAERYPDGNHYIMHNYSQQFRYSSGFYNQESFDQIRYLMDGIIHHPYSRRNVITTWNTSEMASDECPITNCHGTVIQAYVNLKNELSLDVVQRSCDIICGVPHNWLQYWAFLLYLSFHTGRAVGELHWKGNDCHVYEEHKEIAIRMRDMNIDSINTPELLYTPTSTDFKADDFTLTGEYLPLCGDSVKMVV